MGVPSVDISATPLSKMLPNVLDLPFVSRFVSMAIAAGTSFPSDGFNKTQKLIDRIDRYR